MDVWVLMAFCGTLLYIGHDFYSWEFWVLTGIFIIYGAVVAWINTPKNTIP